MAETSERSYLYEERRLAAPHPVEMNAKSIVTSANLGANPGPDRLDRRRVLAGAGAIAVAAAGAGSAVLAQSPAERAQAAMTTPEPLVPTAQFDAAFGRIVGSGTPREGLLILEMPEDAENGNIVPYKISIESPMTEDDHIARVHLLSTQNPQAAVATFHFTPRSGRATVAGRMRLAKTQEVVAVALTSANSLLIGRQTVVVGIGGCATE